MKKPHRPQFSEVEDEGSSQDGPMKRPPSAVYLVHKPAGQTSFQLVQSFREAREGPWRLAVAHGGVLDPFAEGLLVLLVGAGTRLFDRLHDAPKGYVARVQWGAETDTGDAGGRVVDETGRAPELEAIEAATAPLLGWTEQVPPATSNKRVDGERAYLKAHRGEAVVLPPSRVYLHQARWSPGPSEHQGTVELLCRGGFYVRSFVRDVGRRLGVLAHVVSLTRTKLGPWECPPPGAEVELRGPEVLPWLPLRRLSDAEWGSVKRGGRVALEPAEAPSWSPPSGFPPPPGCRLVHQGRLVAVDIGERVVLLPGGL